MKNASEMNEKAKVLSQSGRHLLLFIFWKHGVIAWKTETWNVFGR
jgi:hypothetical protein